MAYFPFQPGQQPMSSSQGVVIASDQSPVSVTGTVTVVGQQGASVSGTVGASVIGLTPVAVTNTPSISGTVQVGNFPTTQNVSGSVVTAQSGTVISSLVSTVPSSVIVGASIFGQLPAGTAVLGSIAALQGTNPWITTFSNPSIYALQLAGSVLATSATVNAGNSSVMLLNGANVIGSVTALQGTLPWTISSVYGNISGSVVAFQGAGWSGSVAATVTNTNLNVSGSVVGFQGGAWAASMVGAPVTSVGGTQANTDIGIRTFGFRNDTVASIVANDKTYTLHSTDSAGRNLTKPFAADENRLDTATSVVSTSVTALFSSVVGLRNYVTDIMVANTGSVATLVTFKDGSTSILGYTIAPAGGGSNINGMAFPLRTAPAQDFTFVAATSSSVLYVTAKGYKAP